MMTKEELKCQILAHIVGSASSCEAGDGGGSEIAEV